MDNQSIIQPEMTNPSLKHKKRNQHMDTSYLKHKQQPYTQQPNNNLPTNHCINNNPHKLINHPSIKQQLSNQKTNATKQPTTNNLFIDKQKHNQTKKHNTMKQRPNMP